MKKVNEELFLADYEALLKEKEDMLLQKDEEINHAKAEIDALPNPSGLITDHVKEVLFGEVAAEIDAKFDFKAIDEKIANAEKYIEEVVEIEEVPTEEVPVETQVDEFGNSIL